MEDRKYCPLSFPRQNGLVECMEGRCAWWDTGRKCCGIIHPAVAKPAPASKRKKKVVAVKLTDIKLPQNMRL